MPSRLLRLQERTALDTFPPELSEEEVGAHDTVGPADRALVWTRRRPDNRAGLAVQLCALRHLGFFPADLTGAPTLVLSWLGPPRVGRTRPAWPATAPAARRCAATGTRGSPTPATGRSPRAT